MKDKLFDTSALLNLVIKNGSRALKSLISQNILDLTMYETGNVIWKLGYLQKRITHQHACKLLESFLLFKENMNILNIDGMEEKIKNLSLDTGLTFYDSAYVVAAQKVGLVLVTDDSSLLRMAKKYIPVISSDDI